MISQFISDIHLCPTRPKTYQKFRAFIEGIAGETEHLYILGDLFEYWIGDDGVQFLGHDEAVEILQNLSQSGCKISVMHGNRDFLIGQAFVELFNGTLIDDSSVIEIGDEPVLLTHGDSLCSDDVEHQKFRAIVASPKWRGEFLALTLEERQVRAMDMRKISSNSKVEKSMELMDVNQNTVIQAMRDSNVRRMIHGHVHKPGIHSLEIDGAEVKRYVLGEWDDGADGIVTCKFQDNKPIFRLHTP